MEWFSKHIKRTYGAEDFDRIETTLQWLIGRKVRSVDGRALSPVSKVPAKIHDLLQVGLRRTIELTEGAVRELNQQNITNSYVLVRGTLETTCLLLDAVRRVEGVVEKDDPAGMNELDKFLMDVLMGFKSKEQGFSEEYTARNVLTIIQRLTKQLEVELMWFYEALSEHAHPNYLGMMGTYQTSPPEGEFTVRFFPRPEDETLAASMKTVVSGLAISVEMLRMAFNHYDVVAARFAALCERDLYEGGTWPKGIEYPVKR
jgi:hypothetical protein